MKKDDEEHKQFLIQQLEWVKERDRILQQIETKLYKMKEIAQYRQSHDLSQFEIEVLNEAFQELKIEVQNLEYQLDSKFH